MPQTTASTLARIFFIEALAVFIFLNAYVVYINTVPGPGLRAAQEFLERDREARSAGCMRRAPEVHIFWPPESPFTHWVIGMLAVTVCLGLFLFALGAEVAENRQFSHNAIILLWLFCLWLIIAGLAYFYLTSEKASGDSLPSYWPYIPLAACGLPAGVLFSVMHRDERWLTFIPPAVGFIILMCMIGSEV